MTPPPRIILSTLNARYSHASFGLRCLLANLGPYRHNACLREFVIGQPPLQIVEEILREDPAIVGFGVYIWNVTETTCVMEALRALRPAVRLVIGGPEVSYEYEDTEIFRLCDHLITGEADLAFADLCKDLCAGGSPSKVIRPPLPDLQTLALPYDEYTGTDLAQRLIYVEASRGCPFRCEFCLSSLDIPVRAFPLEAFLQALQGLLDRGARSFKFVDRTFNLNIKTSAAILNFCLDHHRDGFELHFEMIPDRLPVELRDLLRRFPPGAVQLEIGIQSFTRQVLRDISRPQHTGRIEDNFRFLREHTGVHIHADLILGLPGETLDSFARSFDLLLSLGPGEIQVGFLKRLRGTPIIRHTDAHALCFSPRPPYEVLQTATVPFFDMQRMKRFARYFDMYHNSGNFHACMQLLFSTANSPFAAFLSLSDWLYDKTGQTHQIALPRLYQLLFTYLSDEYGIAQTHIGELMLLDYDRHQIRPNRLEFLRPHVPSVAPPRGKDRALLVAPGRKRRGRAGIDRPIESD